MESYLENEYKLILFKETTISEPVEVRLTLLLMFSFGDLSIGRLLTLGLSIGSKLDSGLSIGSTLIACGLSTVSILTGVTGDLAIGGILGVARLSSII